MSNIITARDSDIIAAEINTIKEDTRRIMIANSIRIGGKLVEAKSMVDHGEWGKWLEEKVDYSQSTANNLMQLYREYGTNQESLFDNWTNSETFANLTYTQHMALLALPFADRLEFAEKNNVEQMSTRELEKAVREELEKVQKERDEAIRERDEAIRDRDQAYKDTEEADNAIAALHDAETEIELKTHEAVILQNKMDVIQKDKERAEKSEQNALNQLKKLQAQLAEAEKREKVALDDLKKAQENPQIPDSVMEQMRGEVEAEAARKATEDLQKQLEDAQSAADEAAKARETAEAQLVAAQKQLKMADPGIIAYQTFAEQFQKDYNVLEDYRLKAAAGNPEAGEKLKKFQTAMLSQWLAALQG